METWARVCAGLCQWAPWPDIFEGFCLSHYGEKHGRWKEPSLLALGGSAVSHVSTVTPEEKRSQEVFDQKVSQNDYGDDRRDGYVADSEEEAGVVRSEDPQFQEFLWDLHQASVIDLEDYINEKMDLAEFLAADGIQQMAVDASLVDLVRWMWGNLARAHGSECLGIGSLFTLWSELRKEVVVRDADAHTRSNSKGGEGSSLNSLADSCNVPLPVLKPVSPADVSRFRLKPPVLDIASIFEGKVTQPVTAPGFVCLPPLALRTSQFAPAPVPLAIPPFPFPSPVFRAPQTWIYPNVYIAPPRYVA